MRSVQDNSDPVFVCKHMKDMLTERCLACEKKGYNDQRISESKRTTKPDGRYVITNRKV